MCVILILEPGYTPPIHMVENATYNNPDGYGLILKHPEHKKLQIIKSKAVNGLIPENDPKTIYDLLKDNEDCQRFLHLRHRTEGPVDEDNTHPFTAYWSTKRQVYFMHNGTLYEYRPKTSNITYNNGVKTEEKSGEEHLSDSKKFNDTILVPLLSKIRGENGSGDIHDEFVTKTIARYWPSTGENRGLLISNDQEYHMIAPDRWKKINDKAGGTFWASNDSYFDKISRGPEYERRKKIEEEARRQTVSRFQGSNTNNYNTWAITNLKNVDLEEVIKLKEGLKSFFNSDGCWDEESFAVLSNVTEAEFLTFCNKHPGDASTMLVMLTSYYTLLFERYQRIRTYVENLRTINQIQDNIEDIEDKKKAPELEEKKEAA